MDTIQQVVIEEIARPTAGHPAENIWLWIACGELIVILVLAAKLLNRKTREKYLLRQRFKADALQQEVNMADVMGNIFQARQLYDQLKRQCHPDRFIDPDLRSRADQLFQQITESKRNYARLQELKTQAEQELNIHF